MTVTDTRAGYRIWASSYDDFANPMIAMAQTAIDATFPTVRGRDVAELGCGTGTNLGRLLPEEPRRLWGFDLSDEMLEVARGRLPDRVVLTQHDVRDALPLEPASVDLILISLVLEHLESIDDVVVAAARALRPMGSMHIYEIHPSLVRGGTGAHFEVGGERIELASHAHDEDEYRRAAERAGLRPRSMRSWKPDRITAEREPKVMKHEGRDMLLSVHLDKR